MNAQGVKLLNTKFTSILLFPLTFYLLLDAASVNIVTA